MRAPILGFLLAAVIIPYGSVRAQFTDPFILAQLSPLETLIARTDQAAYAALTTAATAGGTPICTPGAAAAAQGPNCTGNTLKLFLRLDELAREAAFLSNCGCGSVAQQLGRNLRASAPTEFATFGAQSTEFTNELTEVLERRIDYLRSRELYLTESRDAGRGALGGGASADGGLMSHPWGGFIDGAVQNGRKDDTTNAGGFGDAFALTNREVTFGIDYRRSPSLVLGGIAGYNKKKMNFDSTPSEASGYLSSSGLNALAYAAYDAENLYAYGSVGWQHLAQDYLRNIGYQSVLTTSPAVAEVASGSTTSNAVLASFGAGYDARFQLLTVVPYVKANYQHIDMAGFTEANSNGFDVQYAGQQIKSFDTALGVKLKHVFLTSSGVVVAYARGEFHEEFSDRQRTPTAVYAPLPGLGLAATASADFAIATEPRRYHYEVFAAGASFVRREGLQFYLQYQQTVNLTEVRDHTFAAGLRIEF